MSSVQEQKTTAEGAGKTRAHELRNAELVSRLLAATPPYLYSALPLQPHAFFFSEMLRSFVNARHGCRPAHYHRRLKRRAHKYFAETEDHGAQSATWQRRDWHPLPEDNKEPEQPRPEVPLELTVEKPKLSPKPEQNKPASPGPPGRPASFVDVGTEELPKPAPCVGRLPEQTSTASPANLILPPPPPMWYPPIYNPQFGVDPLNFFIDLRVSGHIYDRKRAVAEGIDTNVNQEVRNDDSIDKRLGMRHRHVSAFSVPVRSSKGSVDAPAKYFDHTTTSRVNHSGSMNGTSYIMRNLKRVYEHLKPLQEEAVPEKNSKTLEDDDTKVECSDVENDLVE